jgi:uncharacterized membrane protein YbhN (UPF0104 family)
MWLVGVAAVVLTGFAMRRFPWHAAGDALLHADLALLVAATVINLTSLVFKGTAWHLLLRTLVPSRWLVMQEATIVGSAVNSISVSGIGEGARVQFVRSRERAPVRDLLASLVGARVVEAVGLVLLIAIAPLFLALPGRLRHVQLAALAVMACVLGVASINGWSYLARWLPEALRAELSSLAAMASPRHVWLPVLLSVGNWGAQWLTYHWTIEAVHVSVSYAASFTALLVSNVGGSLRLTPGNVGIAQASMVLALLSFGIAPEHGVAAGLALQALQVLPVLVIGAMIVGWRGLMPEESHEQAMPEDGVAG